MSLKTREAQYLPTVALAFKNADFDPAFGCAIARQESAWDPKATASNPKDLAMGGAFGLCQMTLDTAQNFLGHKDITPADLYDPAINASLAAELCKTNLKALQGETYSKPDEAYEDLAAMYNSGRLYKHAPYITKNAYVPRVMAFLAAYRALLVGSQSVAK